MIAPWDNVEQAAAEYVSLLLDTAPNGWGQHVHKVYGRSDWMMLKIERAFGCVSTHLAISAEFARRK